MGTIEGGAVGAAVGGGASVFAAALTSMGIPKDSVISYEAEVTADSFLVMVHGAREDVAYAQRILAAANVRRVDIHADTRSREPEGAFVPLGA